jgi:hypothetical protein
MSPEQDETPSHNRSKHTMTKRNFEARVEYTTPTGYHVTAMWADNLKQAIGLCNWYAVETDKMGGWINKAEAIVYDEWATLQLKTITVIDNTK